MTVQERVELSFSSTEPPEKLRAGVERLRAMIQTDQELREAVFWLALASGEDNYSAGARDQLDRDRRFLATWLNCTWHTVKMPT